MKMKELTSKNMKELATTLAEKQAALKVFRFNTAGSSTRNVKEGSVLRKDIARINGLMNAEAKKNK